MTDATPTALEQMRAEILHGLMPCACPGTMACPSFATAVDMLRAHAAQAVADLRTAAEHVVNVVGERKAWGKEQRQALANLSAALRAGQPGKES